MVQRKHGKIGPGRWTRIRPTPTPLLLNFSVFSAPKLVCFLAVISRGNFMMLNEICTCHFGKCC